MLFHCTTNDLWQRGDCAENSSVTNITQEKDILMWIELIPNPIREIVSHILMHAEERLGRTVRGTAHPLVDTSPVCLLPKPIVVLSESL